MTVRPPKATAGDRSPRAAAGRKRIADEIRVSDQTAVAWRPDSPVGDQLLGLQIIEPLQGGIEYIVTPPEEMFNAYQVFKLSPYMGAISGALTANVYGAGFKLDAVIDPTRPEGATEVKQLLAFEKAAQAGSFESDADVSGEELTVELARLRRRIANESTFLENWFKRCATDSTYLKLLVLVGQDIEASGTGYVEVLRDERGYPSRLIWAPAWSIRAKPQGEDLIAVTESAPISKIKWTEDTYQRRFRAYVQIDLQGSVIARYKEYGDPRVMSRKTGLYYSDLSALITAEEEQTRADDPAGRLTGLAATELLSFALPSAISCTYGKPDWTGVYPSLVGGRDVEEENPNLLVDRKVPQMFILVAGGAGIPQKEIESLERKISENQKQGRKSIYILQAKSARTASGTLSPTPTISIEKTKSEQYQDALGLKYLEHAEAQARHAYRLPKAALGQDENVNGDAVQLAYRFAEAQVYDPRREIVIDDRMNSTIVRDLGVQLVRYRTRSRVPKEPNELASIINLLMTAGVLTPDEGRELAGDIFNRKFQDLQGIWSKLPTKLLLAMLQTKNQLVAAALLGSESEQDITARLQAALTAQLGAPPSEFNPAAKARREPQDEEDSNVNNPTFNGNGNRNTASPVDGSGAGLSGAGSSGAVPL